MKQEIARRCAYTTDVIALFKSKPLVWIAWSELADVGGALAWRTRCSDARLELQAAGEGTIEWNKNVRASAYRYVPATPVEVEKARPAGTLFDLYPNY